MDRSDSEYSDNNKRTFVDSDSSSSDSENKYLNESGKQYQINILNIIKLIKSIINKNMDMSDNDVIDEFEKQIKDIKKLYNNKRRRLTRNNIFKKSFFELRYYKNFLNILKTNSNSEYFDLKSYLDYYENYYQNQINSSTNIFLSMPATIKQIEKPNYIEQSHGKNDDDDLMKMFLNLYGNDTTNTCSYDFFNKLDRQEKIIIINKLKLINDDMNDEENLKPNIIKVLGWETSNYNKSIILSKLNQFENLQGHSEYFKLKTWINKIMDIPFGKFINPPVTKESSKEDIKNFLNGVKNTFDENIYGHNETKDQIIKILAQTITNSNEGGNIFALEGPPGVGKTAIIHDGISKVLNRPFAFISLGGATDSAYLEGFDYTYEGSNYGKIADVLIRTKCMNPIIYFDELDKVSETAKGEEIINVLMHLTDTTQNFCFTDKYFGSIELDLSKVLFIFSFNDANKVSRILRDRMKIIHVGGYKLNDKLVISSKFILPKLIKSIGLSDIDIKIPKKVIDFIIKNYTCEGGVRKLKEIINDILLEINLRKLRGTHSEMFKNNKIIITKNMLINDLLKSKRKLEIISIDDKPKVGVVNGLWANKLGHGGLIPVECWWTPTNEKLHLVLTGMQGDVMKESMDVAKTIALRILPDNIKSNIYNYLNNTIDCGIHIHCPDGATYKDGPSAGSAITTCLISLLTGIPVNNKIAMTGEINLKGKVTAIGGLEEKVFGAKSAGVELVLCPAENKKDLDAILNKNPTLISDSFSIKTVENIWQVLDLVLEKNNINFNKF
jgi:endopeptidase La